jgi:tRNA dimethylallyltransferase
MPEAFKVFLLAGPTASGKTAFLERLFTGSSRVCPAEILSADSMQVYRGLNIGTAKPSAELLKKLPHHLIDIREPGEQFNAGDFARLAAEKIREIASRGALPVVSGGTGFYISALVNGLPQSPPANPAVRAALKAELVERGIDALRAELEKCDPVSAARISYNDTYRLLRALEVYRQSGRPLSSFQAASPEDFLWTAVYITMPREILNARIEERARAMFAEGLPEETAALAAAGHTPDEPGMRAIGYSEFFSKTENGWEFRSDNDTIMEEIIRDSRRYAKRQETWFKALSHQVPGLIRVNAAEAGAYEKIQKALETFFAYSYI